jgi:hypothetical protein
VATDGEGEASSWQRVRLNSGDRSAPPPPRAAPLRL